MLACRDIELTLGGNDILRGLSVTVEPGECVAVIGPNGAGKSTLFHVLSGALKPDLGDVGLDDRRLQNWSKRELACRRAVLPQASLLSFPFRVIDVVLLGRSPHAGRTKRSDDVRIAEAVLLETDLVHLADRLYTTLSGGERQRVHLARVLAQIWRLGQSLSDDAASYLLLDEPTNNLDLAHQHALMATARRFATAGNGVLTILHDPNIAATYADRLYVLDQGRVVGEGVPETVLTKEMFESTFGIPVTVMRHPTHDRPVMVPA